MANRKRDSEGKFASEGFTGPIRDNPWTSAAIAAGAAGIGAFLWSKRNRLSDGFQSGMDWLSEMKSERMGGSRDQEQISEEALTLKETGASKGSRSNQESKAGAKAYS